MSDKPERRPGYRLHEYTDETSMFDPAGRWQGGTECYVRTYRVWLPLGLKSENIGDWLDRHEGDDSIWAN